MGMSAIGLTTVLTGLGAWRYVVHNKRQAQEQLYEQHLLASTNPQTVERRAYELDFPPLGGHVVEAPHVPSPVNSEASSPVTPTASSPSTSAAKPTKSWLPMQGKTWASAMGSTASGHSASTSARQWARRRRPAGKPTGKRGGEAAWRLRKEGGKLSKKVQWRLEGEEQEQAA